MSLNIVQILPAEPGWNAVFDEPAGRIIVRVVMWALVEDITTPGYRWVEGLVNTKEDGMSLANQFAYFKEYEAPKQSKYLMPFSYS